MSEAADFTIGAVVNCEDGKCGELQRVVIDSDTDDITHLVVGPNHEKSMGRLVPVQLIESTNLQEIRLRCTLAQFESLDPAEVVEVRTGLRVDLESQPASLRTMGRLGAGAMDPDGLGDPNAEGPGLVPARRGVDEDNIPDGEGEVRRGQPVHASDGPIGHVSGLLADSDDGHVSDILLAEGHLWGEKEVAIPITAVKFVVDDGVHLNLTKHEVGDLPPVDPSRIE